MFSQGGGQVLRDPDESVSIIEEDEELDLYPAFQLKFQSGSELLAFTPHNRCTVRREEPQEL